MVKEPMTVKYCLRNAQNDIAKIIDNSGSTVVEYAHLNSD